ncbi:hypothetical protein OG497_38075 [Streptomyces sp. NBC_01242]|uniref:hypothetical protein n=1 Tax=Streptomyces sp. NBC_01242 TaxID=2903795 RepID=UPI00224E8A81|nr:hypothetical protein [Streptomyces sp. NBC_01242]MCX4799668.1 hypothetical protein [Streptomyces sp. NBC_01242]
MTTTKIPEHIQRAMEDAALLGWDVVCTTKSVVLTPKGARRGISFSLTKPPTPEQVRVQLDRAGLYSALKKLQSEDTPALPEPERGVTEKKTNAGKLVCPECKADHFTRPASLGSHRQKSHGVPGTSQTTTERKAAAAKAPVKKAPAKAAAKKTVPAQRTAPGALLASPPVSPWFGPAEVLQGDVRTSSPEVAEAVEALIHAVTKENQNGLAPLQEKIKQQDEKIAALQDFKDKVEAEVANINQAPIQTLSNIMKHGGEGFGVPKA